MKYILLLSIFISSFGFAQFSNEIYAFEKEALKYYKLPKVYRQELIQAKKRFIRKMYNDTVHGICGGKLQYESLAKYRKDFDSCILVHDFDYDGDYDILFYGGCYEKPIVSIYYKNRKTYEQKVLGRQIVNLERHADSCSLTVLKTPCCGDFRFQQIAFVSKKKGHQGFEQTANESFYCDLDTENKSHYSIIDTTITLTTEKALWMAPDLSQETIDFFDSEGGAVMGTVKENTTVRALNKCVINGISWYYVNVKTTDEVVPTKFWNFPYYGTITAFRGWISE